MLLQYLIGKWVQRKGLMGEVAPVAHLPSTCKSWDEEQARQSSEQANSTLILEISKASVNYFCDELVIKRDYGRIDLHP